MTHPLRPLARWILFPLGAAALAAGVAWWIGEPDAGIELVAAGWSGSAALAAALSSRAWMGPLFAAPLGWLAMLAAYAGAYRHYPDVLSPLLDLMTHPRTLYLIAVQTVPLAGLHVARFRRPELRPGAVILVYALASLAAGAAYAATLKRLETWPFLLAPATYLSGAVALELALRFRVHPAADPGRSSS